MSKNYTVQKNESLASIAKDLGLLPETLKGLQDDPSACKENGFLEEGLCLLTREIEPKSQSASTGSKHSFTRKFGLVPEEDCCSADGLELGSKKRKVKLPVDEKWGYELYVLGDKSRGARVYKEIETSVIAAKTCLRGEKESPVAIIQHGNERFKETKKSIDLFATDEELNPVLRAIPLFKVIETIFNCLDKSDDATSIVTSKLFMCDVPVEMSKPLSVKCFEPVEASGTAFFEFDVYTGTAGFGTKFETGGNASLKIGNNEFSTEVRSEDQSGLNKPSDMFLGPSAAGFLSTALDSLTKCMSADTKASIDNDVTTGASYINLGTKLGVTIGQFDLSEDADGPGLGLDFSIKLKFDPLIKLAVHIDILDAILLIMAPATIRWVHKIRSAIANGEKVAGKVEAFLEYGGELKLEVGLKAENVSNFSPLGGSSKLDIKPELLGGGKIFGMGHVGISMKAQTLFVKFEGSADAILNTAIFYEVQKADNGYESRSGFEGLFGEIKCQVKVGAGKKNERPKTNKKEAVEYEPAAGSGTKATIVEGEVSEWAPFTLFNSEN